MRRPDKVYRTGVLMPMVGYEPGANVQAVAQRFTNAGPYVQGSPTAGIMLSGPLAAAPVGLFQRIKIRFQLARSERRARRMLEKLAKIGLQPQQPMAGLRGPEPARQGMARQAAAITATMMLPTPIMRTKLEAGTAIIPQSSGIPHQLAALAVQRAPNYVQARAAAYGYANWARKRAGVFDPP